MENTLFNYDEIKSLSDILLKINTLKKETWTDDERTVYFIDSFYLTEYEAMVLDSFCNVGNNNLIVPTDDKDLPTWSNLDNPIC